MTRPRRSARLAAATIEQLDEFDDDAFAEWYGPFHASEKFAWPDRPGWSEEEIRVFFRDKSDVDAKIVVARDGTGRAIGSLDVSLLVKENLLQAYLVRAVHPDHRRSGVGSSLLEFGEQMACDQPGAARDQLTADRVELSNSRGHRGHRLGMLVKLANVRALMDVSPASKRVETGNAVSNEPMIRVNEAMGFVLVGLGMTWQKKLI